MMKNQYGNGTRDLSQPTATRRKNRDCRQPGRERGHGRGINLPGSRCRSAISPFGGWEKSALPATLTQYGPRPFQVSLTPGRRPSPHAGSPDSRTAESSTFKAMDGAQGFEMLAILRHRPVKPGRAVLKGGAPWRSRFTFISGGSCYVRYLYHVDTD